MESYKMFKPLLKDISSTQPYYPLLALWSPESILNLISRQYCNQHKSQVNEINDLMASQDLWTTTTHSVHIHLGQRCAASSFLSYTMSLNSDFQVLSWQLQSLSFFAQNFTHMFFMKNK